MGGNIKQILCQSNCQKSETNHITQYANVILTVISTNGKTSKTRHTNQIGYSSFIFPPMENHNKHFLWDTDTRSHQRFPGVSSEKKHATHLP